MNFIGKRPSPYAGDRQSDTTEAAGHTRSHGNNLRNPAGGRPPKPHKARPGGRTHGNTQKGPKGGGQTPPGANTSLAKGVGGERGNIGQTKISSKREKEREQLMEPEETVTALKIRERVRSKKEGEEDRSWKD